MNHVDRGAQEVIPFEMLKISLASPVTPSPSGTGALSSAATNTPMRGIDKNGQAYHEVTNPDGSKRRRTQTGTVVIRPDGTRVPVLRANAPMPTPPPLPGSAEQGRTWFERHNEKLLEMLRRTVNNNQAQMDDYVRKEAQETNGDVFKQIYLRAGSLDVLIWGP